MSTTDLMTASSVRPASVQPTTPSKALPMRHVPALTNAQSRALHNWQAAWRLAPLGAAPATWLSLLALQQASVQKLLEQQNACLNDWREWWSTAQQLPRANTLSKLLEQEVDLALRVVQICGNQAVNWASLQENLEVNYGHWANQQAVAATGQ
jgi:hypothetical protein